MKDSLKICVFGNQTTTTELVKSLYKNKHGVSHLVTLKKDDSVISKISNIDLSLDKLCIDYGINIYYADTYSLNSERDKEFFSSEKFDVGISCSWQRLIPKDILDTFEFGVFGWHGSMFRFPDGRGRSPLNWSIRLGGKVIYHNLFKYDSGADTGMIFETKEVEIKKKDNILSLLNKIQRHMNDSVSRLLDSIYREDTVLIEQSGDPTIYFPKLTEQDGQLFPSRVTYNKANNIVRSCTHPFPGAFIVHKGKNIKIWKMKKSYFKKVSPGFVAISKRYIYIGFIDCTAKVDLGI